METIALYAFVLANFGILGGYLFLSAAVVPRATARLKRTRYGGILFFATCGFTHFELAVHAAFTGGLSLDDMISWHMLVVHVLQVIAVWMFVTGLYVEFVKWGPWGAGHRRVVPVTEVIGHPPGPDERL